MRRTIPLLLSALVPVMAVLAWMPPSQADPGGFSVVWDKGPGGERYVALGDSFASGPGIAPQRPEGCTRSERNFSTLFAQALDVDAFTDASCGGATTKELFAAQGAGSAANPRQLDALSADTTLVTFGTIGGNDIGLVQLAASCFTTNCVPTSGDPYAAKFDALKTQLTKGVAEAMTKAPDAQILVVGYGTYLPPAGCVDVFGGALTLEEFGYVQSQIDRMSDTLEAVAVEQGVDFVDMRDIPGSVDHTACAAPERQWIRALNTYNDGVTLHPSACGMSAMAQHLTRTLEDLRGFPQTPFDDSCVSAGGPASTPAPSPTATPTVSPTASPTATPTATPTTAAQPTRETRLAALRAEARTVRVRASCVGGTKVRLGMRGDTDHVTRVRFVVGGQRVAVAPEAPFRVTAQAGTVRHSGLVKAKVTLRDGDLRIGRHKTVERPRCLR
ncbi:SGNH/GDSL hydrolase family protein [Nocardioides houyundeii]|uniref:SGNH/GDSL hydrolase family protein n=1 Tax=Nocardioides houyundeii TaxID=2045452 RepID=UPI0013151FA1|nr:SGNH/GDSL hydrolase family protein [Nocardioides houyundeii]